jgi:hypothetical protein
MTRQRRDEWLVELDTNAAGVLDTDEETATLSLAPISAQPDPIRRNLIDDQRKTGTHQGALAKIPGLWDINLPLTAYAEGTRAVPAVGDLAVMTAMGHLLGAASQRVELTRHTEALVGATATVIGEGLANGHKLTAGTDVGMVLVNGVARPYTYADPTLTLLQAMPAAPAVGDDLSAGIIARARASWDDLPRPLVARLSGNDTRQNYRAWGGVAGFSVGAVSPDEVPQIEASMMFAEGEHNYVRARPAFAGPRPTVWAGSRVDLSLFGATAFKSMCARIEIKVAQAWQKITCPGPLNGVANWIRGPIADTVVLTVPHDDDPSDVTGGAYDDWLEELESGAEDHFHLTAQWGYDPGGTFAAYFPRLVLTDVTQTTLDDTDARVLTFVPSALAAFPWVSALL